MKGKYMNGVLRRVYGRRSAATAAFPLLGSVMERLLAGRTCPECKAVVADNASLRYKH